MNFKRIVKVGAIGIALQLAASAVAFAAPIQGTFTLAQNTPFNPPKVYSGTFTTEDTTGLVDGDSVALASFFLSDTFEPTLPAGGVDLTFTNVANLSAILSSENTIYRLDGTVQADNVLPNAYVLSLTSDPFDGTQGDWGLGGGANPVAFLNGDQFVPEPSGIALLGAGLFAAGFARRRRKSA